MVGDYPRVSINIVRAQFILLGLDSLQQSLEVLFVTNRSVGIDLEFTAFYYVNSLFAHRLHDTLVRDEYFLGESFGHFCLKRFSPVADKENTALDNVQIILEDQSWVRDKYHL